MVSESLIEDYKLFDNNAHLAPLHEPNSTDWLKKWWARRAVPISQGHIKQMLNDKGLLGPEDYLVKNLGLSLTDYYWISPIDSGLQWKDVNLFENEFHNDIKIDALARKRPKGSSVYPSRRALTMALSNDAYSWLGENRDIFAVGWPLRLEF